MKGEDLSEVVPSAAVSYCFSLLQKRLAVSGGSGLMVGCGRGNEAVLLRRLLLSFLIVGLDIEFSFSPFAVRDGNLVIGDAKVLPFYDNSFDFAVAIHSLEHVGNPSHAVAEVKRVLRPGGWFFVGVPNKNRIVTYQGLRDSTLGQIVLTNGRDFLARLRRKFENELGAHAGFTREELMALLKVYFKEKINFFTEEYINYKWGGRIPAKFLKLLLLPKLIKHTAPAHYVLCRK